MTRNRIYIGHIKLCLENLKVRMPKIRGLIAEVNIILDNAMK